MKIVFEKEQPISWNKLYSGTTHWSKRAARANEIHLLVWSKTGRLKRFTEPVRITFTVYFKGRCLDTDNISVKEWIDGLKKYVIVDDTPQYVPEVLIKFGGKDPVGRIEIDLSPIIST